MRRALLLDKEYVPIRFVDEREAICLLYLKKVELLILEEGRESRWDEDHGLVNGKTFPAGATLRLLARRCDQRQYRKGFSRLVVLNRDNWKCQYCGIDLTSKTATIDHVMPSSRGGKTDWLNCVAACHVCNRKKGDLTMTEAEMSLIHQPSIPRNVDFWDVRCVTMRWHPDWSFFINR